MRVLRIYTHRVCMYYGVPMCNKQFTYNGIELDQDRVLSAICDILDDRVISFSSGTWPFLLGLTCPIIVLLALLLCLAYCQGNGRPYWSTATQTYNQS